MRKPSSMVPLAAFLLPVVACGSSDSSGGNAGSAIVARFDATAAVPAFLDVPFPSDLYSKDGKYVTLTGVERVFTQNPDVLGGQIAGLNGWSRIAPAMFAVDDTPRPPNGDTGEPTGAAIDRASLPADED